MKLYRARAYFDGWKSGQIEDKYLHCKNIKSARKHAASWLNKQLDKQRAMPSRKRLYSVRVRCVKKT